MTTPPDIIRAAYAELIVTDLAAARWFYVDVLGLVVTAEEPEALYLRAFEEYTHHSLVLRAGPTPALARLAYRVRGPEQLTVAERYFAGIGVETRRVAAGTTRGIGEAVRVHDPLGFPVEFFYETTHTERFTQHYHRQPGNAISRLDHFNVMVPDVRAAYDYYTGLGFGVSETIEDSDSLYATWLFRKPTVHDIAITGGDGPRLHHIAFASHERHQILHTCDVLGALRAEHHIERGPGRHGVSNAFYLYLRDPDGHRIEIYTSDYYTGDPDNPTVRWDVTDNRRRSFWGHEVVPSWYNEASEVLNLDGGPVPISSPPVHEASAATIGADGFGVAGTGENRQGFKLGHQA
ncbi:3,4-dihydroxyphenylacetate 2,3-dioxygenase [Haloechinothrix sp. YIM 98757]|uniref:3,4-dihydroxyphenylacetate 2,3-dioxygenase n=1 Tax=Haloechinothrix aidingensis TaxID=2752311 RepID=A0A838ABJ9_9PSEU|nr:3,4-dihydroxyphenylacetate 2,3-dioxygenase [Haloechinothrix aidingensis]MBA0126613.1 3,4-dihydroxyphenylacetate 2,3-dioxygenase [Haloechinothrix aidingensis]